MATFWSFMLMWLPIFGLTALASIRKEETQRRRCKAITESYLMGHWRRF